MKTLTELADFYKTDKGTLLHRYTVVYETLFRSVRNEKLRILEIGIYKGDSLRMWYDYFPNAHIFGYDIRVRRGIKRSCNERLTTFQGSQASREDLMKFITLNGGDFDIILDDGSHISTYTEISLGFLFPYLKEKGRYVIEDLGCEHAREVQNAFKEMVKTGVLHSLNMSSVESAYLADNIETFGFLDPQEKLFVLEHK